MYPIRAATTDIVNSMGRNNDLIYAECSVLWFPESKEWQIMQHLTRKSNRARGTIKVPSNNKIKKEIKKTADAL